MWEDAWREGRTGWDTGAPAPALLELIEAGTLPGGRALVPGCGAGYDVFALAGSGRYERVTGLDLAPTAAERFAAVREEYGADPARACIEIADFFEHRPPQPYDLVWDYTFLCAIDPSLREQWAEKMGELVRPATDSAGGGELVTLLFPVVPNERYDAMRQAGPPFPLRPDRVRDLLDPWFEMLTLEPVTRSHPPRTGMEWLGRWQRRAK